MRVLYFHQHFTTPRGASGTRSYEFARALAARGHEVVMVCGATSGTVTGLPPPADGADGAEGKIRRGFVDGFEVVALPAPYSNRDSLPRRALGFAKFALRAAALALREPCDLVFATSTPLTAVVPGALAKIFRRKPFVFEARDLWPELPRALGMRNPFWLGAMSLLEWTGCRAADGLVGLSPGIVAGLRRRAPATTPAALIPNGCDLDLFKPLPAPAESVTGDNGGTGSSGERAENAPFTAGFTGAHGIANGLDAVLDAAAVLMRRGERRVRFLFVGDGNRKDALVARAIRERLDNCEFRPPVPKTELAALTASLGCGLMTLRNVPAFYNGTSPNKFFDYIAAGVPVLNNYPGWLAGIVRESGCGVVVPPDNPEAFADALTALAASPDNNAAMRRAARALAERSFARQKLAAEFCDFLEARAAGKVAPE